MTDVLQSEDEGDNHLANVEPSLEAILDRIHGLQCTSDCGHEDDQIQDGAKKTSK